MFYDANNQRSRIDYFLFDKLDHISIPTIFTISEDIFELYNVIYPDLFKIVNMGICIKIDCLVIIPFFVVQFPCIVFNFKCL